MRRFILRTLLIVVCLAILGLVWIFGGRQLSLLLDRVGTVALERIPVTGLTYEGAASGGLFRFANGMLITTGPDNHLFPLSIAPDAKNKLILFTSGKSFILGDVMPATAKQSGATFAVASSVGPHLSISIS